MKRLFILSILLLIYTYSVTAQSDCMYFFPTEEGTKMVNNTYDANDKLISSMVSVVGNSHSRRASESYMEINFTSTDENGKAYAQGKIIAQCNEGLFSVKMMNRGLIPEIVESLYANTKLVADFLDYPNTYNASTSFEEGFEMNGGEYTIDSEGDGENIKVHVYARRYIRNEKISTPAGSFEASKVKFNFDVTLPDNSVVTYNGIEWYANGAGIVRTETYDKENKLLHYSVLTSIGK